MTALLIIIFGAVVGFLSYSIRGSGFGLKRNVVLGAAGSVLSSSVMGGAYIINNFGSSKIMGLNWYSLSVAAVGSLVTIYIASLYRRENFLSPHKIVSNIYAKKPLLTPWPFRDTDQTNGLRSPKAGALSMQR